MSKADDHLREWRQAGLIDEVTERRVRDFEGTRSTRPSDGPTLLEALVYLGLAIIAVGVVVLVANHWQHLQPWSRVAVAMVPGALGILAGKALRGSALPAMQRGADVMWLVAAALLTAGLAVIGSELDWQPERVVLACGIAATGAAVTLWVFSPSHAQVVGIAAGALLFSVGLGANAGTHHLAVASLSTAAFGGMGILLSETGVLRPRTSAHLLSAVAFASGAYFSGLEDIDPAWTEGLVFVAAATLATLSLQRGALSYMVTGVVALFAGLVTLIVRHVNNPTIAALALVFIGAMVIAAVMLLVRLRPWSRLAAEP